MTAVPSSVPSSVPPAISKTPVLTQPQLGERQFYRSGGGTERIPEVPRTDTGSEAPGNPRLGYRGALGQQPGSGSAGAPSVPVDGFLFKQGTIDPHYLNPFNKPGPKVNNPPTRGMFTWVKTFLNHIATSQDVDEAGWKAQHPQQRTSVMRITPPAHGIGYISGEQFTPKQMPQQPNTARTVKTTGTQPYGTGVLNSDVLGAGQVAGGIGGNLYTPQPGPPPTNSTAGNSGDGSGMPTWG